MVTAFIDVDHVVAEALLAACHMYEGLTHP